MSSKHLYVEQADVPHAAAWRASTTWSDGSPLWDERYVKNSPTCCALLNVGFMIVLRRVGWYVLIWARRAVPTNLQLSSFQTSQLLEQNLKNYFSALVLCQCCSRNDAVKLYGRSHPAPNLYEGDLLSGSWALWVSRVEGVQGFLRGSWLQRSNESNVFTIQGSQGSKVQGLTGLKG